LAFNPVVHGATVVGGLIEMSMMLIVMKIANPTTLP